MDIVESINIAVSTLSANKLRSILTMLGMIIGNASTIAVIAIGQGAQNYTVQRLESFGPNRLGVFGTSDDSQLLLSDVEAIATQAPAVKNVAPNISSRQMLSYLSRNMKVGIIGTTSDVLYVCNLAVARGRFFNPTELQQEAQVVALGPDLAHELFGSENPLGKEIQINKISFQVIGVMQAKGSFAGSNEDDVAYVPITTMADQINGSRSPYDILLDYMQVSAKDKQSIPAAAFQITNVLTRKHGKKNFAVSANKSSEELVSKVTVALSLMLAVIASISLLVGGIGIMNIMLVSVTERTREIGLRKAIGATQQDILTQFLIEAVILSGVGGLVGIFVGVGGATIVGVLTPLKPTLPLPAIALAVGISGSMGLIFGVVPARQAAKLDPIVALHSQK